MTRVIQLFVCHLMIISFQWGHLGAAIATNIVYLGDMLIQDFWVSCYQDSLFLHMWVPWSKSTLDGLGMFFEYSIPNCMLETSFRFSLELFVCISGYGIILNPTKNNIEKNEFSAITVCMNIFSIFLIIAYGMSYTVSAFVGNYQATVKSLIAKKYMKVSVLFGLFVILFSSVMFKYYHVSLLKQYLNSQETRDKITTRLPVFLAMVTLISLYCMLNGVIKGLGLQSKAVLLSLICIYAISLPASFVLGFKPEYLAVDEDLKKLKGLTGLFIGFSSGFVVLNLAYLYIIFSLDWRTNSH